jgi:hypothetical protein
MQLDLFTPKMIDYKPLYWTLCRIVTAMLDPEYVPRAIQRRFKPRSHEEGYNDPNTTHPASPAAGTAPAAGGR